MPTTGWPSLVAVSAASATMTALHRRSTMLGPYDVKGVPVVTLRRGERADAVFTAGDNPGPGKTTCAPHYRYLRVTPPGRSRSVVLSAWLPWLGAFMPNCTNIELSMVVPRADLIHG